MACQSHVNSGVLGRSRGWQSLQDVALEGVVRPWRCSKAKSDGNFAETVIQDGPERG